MFFSRIIITTITTTTTTTTTTIHVLSGWARKTQSTKCCGYFHWEPATKIHSNL